ILVVILLARGCRGSRRLLLGNAFVTLGDFTGLTFQRTDPVGLFRELRNERLGHSRVIRSAALEAREAAQRGLGRGVQNAVRLAWQRAAQPNQFGLRRENEPRCVRRRRRTLGGFRGKFVDSGRDRGPKRVAGDGLGESGHVLHASPVAAPSLEIVELGQLCLAGRLERGSLFGLPALGLGLLCQPFGFGAHRGRLGGGLAALGFLSSLPSLCGFSFGFRGFGLLFGFRRLGTALGLFAL